MKREGLGNANQIPIEQAMSWGVTQARVEGRGELESETFPSALQFAPNPQVGLTYCAAALSFLGHVALKSKDDIEHLPILCGNVLEHQIAVGANCAATKRSKKKDLIHNQTNFFSHKVKTHILQLM